MSSSCPKASERERAPLSAKSSDLAFRRVSVQVKRLATLLRLQVSRQMAELPSHRPRHETLHS